MQFDEVPAFSSSTLCQPWDMGFFLVWGSLTFINNFEFFNFFLPYSVCPSLAVP